ncbi:MAG: hypothetical protein F6K32_03505 [Desertifilum sp. SIO1I2]|nr:hypothetical protein [Desertifilum sp. SIO1I2]
MATLLDRYNRNTSVEEQRIYDHLLNCVQTESPAQLIDRFRALFIDGLGYPDAQAIAALNQVTASKFAEQDFKFVLNRCCHILINHWRTHSQMQTAIPELVALFDRYTTSNGLNAAVHLRSTRRLRLLVHQFVQSEQFLTLRRLAQVLSEAAETRVAQEEPQPLGNLIHRYPYLYAHCLLSEESTYEQQQTVRQIQSQKQRQFEVDLSQYVTYQVRRSQMARQPGAASRIIVPAHNPTLLSDRELNIAVKHFIGKVEGSYTYRDLAQSFITHTSQTRSFKDYKDNLYQYLTSSISPDYGNRQFNNQLYNYLNHTIPQSDSQKLSDFLVVRTCSQLLNFLVVESRERPHHFVFIDLVANLGATLTTGILLKIVLICRKVKPYLEKRLSILYNHYETYNQDAIQWLVYALENMNVALSTHFGSLDLSLLR